MTRADMLALADRVEREEPSEDLDTAIFRAVGNPWTHPYMVMAPDVGPIRVPYFCTSLDAAASLMPENWFLKDVWVTEMVCVRLVYGTKTYASGISDDEPRARTAAALRARAMEIEDE